MTDSQQTSIQTPLANPVQGRAGAITDSDLARLAIHSPVAAYIRSLSTDVSRRGMQQAITIAVDLLSPNFLPASLGKGRNGNGSLRFAMACGLPFQDLRTDRLCEFRAQLVRSGLATATSNKVIACLKGVLKQCWRQKLIDGDQLARSSDCLTSIRGMTVSKGRHLSQIEIAKVFKAIAMTRNPAAARDGALMALLCIGLRREEVASVQLNDYNQESGRLTVHGKGNKERSVFLTNGAKSAVDDWIAVRGVQTSMSLLLQVNKGGIIVAKGITSQSVYSALLSRASSANVICSPHDLRRTFAGNCLDAGVDIVTLQNLMGHSSPTTTSKYDRRPEEARRIAMATVSVPYVRCQK